MKSKRMQESEQLLIFEEWLAKHKALLFKVIRSYAFTSDDRDDLFQNICLQIWRSIPRFRKESAVTTWLYRISLNTAMNWSTKEKKHEQGHGEIESMEHLLFENDQEEDERVAWLYAEIAKLDEVDRSLSLLLLDGFNYKEMSEMLGISESNVGVKIHRIKKHLMTKSETYDYHGV